ncbi:MAG: beta-propeller domain-containing protein [Firmicutes bacterium]|nr:beta-propeller domain-containing protein [Bacillota bacterium]
MKEKFMCIVKKALALICVLSALLFAGCDPLPRSGSGDNYQVEGIEEADIIKVTDDGRIFNVQSDGVTVSLAEDGVITLLSYAQYSGFEPCALFVLEEENILLVIGVYATVTLRQIEHQVLLFNGEAWEYRTEVYTYLGPKTSTTLKFYDLSPEDGQTDEPDGELPTGPSELRLMRETTFSGIYKTARLVDGYFYVLISNVKTDETAYYDTHDGEQQADFSEGEDETGVLAVKIEVAGIFTAPYTAAIYTGDIYDVYCSQNALYTMAHAFDNAQNKYSEVSRISLGTLLPESGSGNVGGMVNDRFALHDDGAHIFAVYRSDKTDATYLNVYDREFNLLKTYGPYAQGESLYATRYDEDEDTGKKYCYFVTFKWVQQIKIDPLFKIDITDPLNAVMTGSLEIPGYSAYMQKFGHNSMIGVGFDINPQTGATTGLKVSLFNVSGAVPKETNSLTIPKGNTDATSNAMAILCKKDLNIFAFPAQCDYGYFTYSRNVGAYTYHALYSQGAYIYGIGKNGKLELRAFLTNLPGGYQFPSYAARKKIRSIVVIGNYLYTVADGYISSYNLSDFSPASADNTYDVRIVKKDNTVTFLREKNGDVYSIQDYSDNEPVTIPGDPVKKGYLFNGWTISAPVSVSEEKIYKTTKLYCDQSYTLYATWKPDPDSAKSDDGGNNNGGGSTPNPDVINLNETAGNGTRKGCSGCTAALPATFSLAALFVFLKRK